MNDQKIIDIVGKVPPPIGGVNIHVKRLTEFLNRENYRFNFFRLSIKDIFKLLLRGNTIHLHTSNVYVRLAFSFFYGIILNNNLIITYHGTVGRFSLIKNFIDGLSIRWCTYPIVLNNISFSRANNLNANTKLFSAFIPPYSSIYPISLTTDKLIRQIRNQFDNVFCTNAYGYTFDINGREIYGILSLSKIIKKYPSFALIISDPNNGYSETILRNNDEGNNVFRINYPHDFVDILKLSDCFIRSTTTDGDSLSVHEALYYAKPVIASDCVSRPKGVILYKAGDWDELEERILSYKKYSANIINTEHGGKQLLKLYNSIQ